MDMHPLGVSILRPTRALSQALLSLNGKAPASGTFFVGFSLFSLSFCIRVRLIFSLRQCYNAWISSTYGRFAFFFFLVLSHLLLLLMDVSASGMLLAIALGLAFASQLAFLT